MGRSRVPTEIPAPLARRLYSYADADNLARVSRGTSKRWIEGYTYRRPGGERIALPPITADREITGGGVSFSDLIEIVAIGKFKDIGFSIPRVRKIVTAAQETFGVRHPLSMLSFKTDGRDVFVEDGTLLHNLLRNKSQPAWDAILGPFLETLDYRDAIAYRWWPLGKDRPILVDPEYGFGQPVVAGSGVRIEIIRERISAGDSNSQIAYDFAVSEADVEAVSQYYMQRIA